MKKFQIGLLALFTVLFSNCSDDDNTSVPVNEEEVITTVSVVLTSESGNTVNLISRDLDGDGPNAPQLVVTRNLTANTLYQGSVDFVNELVQPTESLLEEIIEEGVDHQVFYNLNQNLGTFTYRAPIDLNGNPIGTSFKLQTNNAGSGTLTVILRHHPDKTGANVSQGDATNAGGHTDIQVSFPIVVE